MARVREAAIKDMQIANKFSVGQALQFKDWRYRIGRAVWDLHESEGMAGLRALHMAGISFNADVFLPTDRIPAGADVVRRAGGGGVYANESQRTRQIAREKGIVRDGKLIKPSSIKKGYLIIWFGARIQEMFTEIMKIRKEIAQFIGNKYFVATYKRSEWDSEKKKWTKATDPGRILGGRYLRPDYLKKVNLAYEGISLSVTTLVGLTAVEIDQTIQDNWEAIEGDMANVSKLIFDMCPVGDSEFFREALGPVKKKRERKAARSSIGTGLFGTKMTEALMAGNLDGGVAEFVETVRSAEEAGKIPQLPYGCYSIAMTALRLSYRELYVVQKKADEIRMQLRDEGYWYDKIAENKSNGVTPEKPAKITKLYDNVAKAETAVVKVFDSRGNLVYEAVPMELAGVEYFQLKAALSPAGKARVMWNYKKEMETPKSGPQFLAPLTDAQIKKLQKYAAAHPGQQLSIVEMAVVAGVDINLGYPQMQIALDRKWDAKKKRFVGRQYKMWDSDSQKYKTIERPASQFETVAPYWVPERSKPGKFKPNNPKAFQMPINIGQMLQDEALSRLMWSMEF